MNTDDDRLTEPDDPALQYLKTAEVAAMLGIPAQTIRRWLREPKFTGLGFPRPFVLHGERGPDRSGAYGRQSRFLFDRAEIVRWLESKREVRR